MKTIVKVKNEVKWGAIFSYILIILNATYGFFLTPYILGQIGEAAYGVYKTITAFTSSLMVLDLGLGGTMMRYIAKYRADHEEEKIPNFIAMGAIQTAVVASIVGLVTVILYQFIETIYQNGLQPAEIEKAKDLYIFLAIGLVVHIFENLLNGIISGYNKFSIANGIKIVRLLVRIVLVIVLLGLFKDSLALVIIDLTVTVLFVLAELVYLTAILKVKVKYTHWNRSLFFESFVYTTLMFLSLFVDQVNMNFSNVAIGAILNSSAVTLYSMAVLIFAMYQNMSCAISGVMLPTVTNTLKNDDECYTETTALIVKAGRIQFLLLGAVFAGFIVVGRQFISLWLGDGFNDVYPLVLILLGPALFELCINVCLSILRAKNMLGFRTIVITVAAVLNLAITLLFTKRISYYAPAIGTALSFLLGSVIAMCIFYRKKLGIRMLKLYAGIFKGIWLAIVLSAIAAFAATQLVTGTVLQFILGFVTFVLVYAVTLLLFGLNKEEKNILISIKNKFSSIVRRKINHD